MAGYEEGQHPRAHGKWTDKGFSERESRAAQAGGALHRQAFDILSKAMGANAAAQVLGRAGGGGRAAPAPPRSAPPLASKATRPQPTPRSAPRPSAPKPVAPARATPAPVSARKPASGNPPKVEAAIRHVELHELIGRSTEKAVVHDAQGNRIFEREGTKGYVDFTRAEVLGFHGASFTHNHPSGVSFSVDDLRLAAVGGFAEVRAVGTPPGGEFGGRPALFRAAPGTVGWPPVATITRAYRDHYNATVQEFNRRLAARPAAINDLNGDFHHVVNERVAKELGFTYERVPLVE